MNNNDTVWWRPILPALGSVVSQFFPWNGFGVVVIIEQHGDKDHNHEDKQRPKVHHARTPLMSAGCERGTLTPLTSHLSPVT